MNDTSKPTRPINQDRRPPPGSCFIVFGAATVKGVAGLGFPLITVPLVANIVGPHAAVVIIAVPTVASNLFMVAHGGGTVARLRQLAWVIAGLGAGGAGRAAGRFDDDLRPSGGSLCGQPAPGQERVRLLGHGAVSHRDDDPGADVPAGRHLPRRATGHRPTALPTDAGGDMARHPDARPPLPGSLPHAGARARAALRPH